MKIFAEGVFLAISRFIHVDYISSNGGGSDASGTDTVLIILTAVATISTVALAALFLWWRKKREEEIPRPPDVSYGHEGDGELDYDQPYDEQYE